MKIAFVRFQEAIMVRGYVSQPQNELNDELVSITFADDIITITPRNRTTSTLVPIGNVKWMHTHPAEAGLTSDILEVAATAQEATAANDNAAATRGNGRSPRPANSRGSKAS